MWQTLITLILVAAAATYLVRALRRRWTGQDSGCAFCPHRGGCTARPTDASHPTGADTDRPPTPHHDPP